MRTEDLSGGFGENPKLETRRDKTVPTAMSFDHPVESNFVIADEIVVGSSAAAVGQCVKIDNNYRRISR